MEVRDVMPQGTVWGLLAESADALTRLALAGPLPALAATPWWCATVTWDVKGEEGDADPAGETEDRPERPARVFGSRERPRRFLVETPDPEALPAQGIPAREDQAFAGG